jgi:hypothetical protein
MGKRRHAANEALAALAVALTLCGCFAEPHARAYHRVSEAREIDPLTGDTVITAIWKFSNGDTTATFKRIPKGNDVRRGDHAPIPSPRL